MKPQDLKNLVKSKEFKEHYEERRPIMIMVTEIYKALSEEDAVLIGDVLNYWKFLDIKNEQGYTIRIIDSIDCGFLFQYWKKLIEPLEEQSDECIKHVHKFIN